MAEIAKQDLPKSIERSWPATKPSDVLRIIGEKYKAEIIAAIPAKDADLAVRPGQLDRPVPRPARALHRQAQGVQADARRRRVLARRLEERDAAAHLRHGLGDEGGPGRVPQDARGGREARPPPPRHAARPVPHAGGGAGPGVLAPEGLDAVAAGRAVHAPRVPRQRLPGGARAADPRQEPVGEDRPLGELPREHVHHLVGEPRLRGEADELPRPHPDLQQGRAQLPRPAAALRRVRRAATATSPPARCTA